MIFYGTRARREMEAGTSACFVLVLESAPERIAGFTRFRRRPSGGRSCRRPFEEAAAVPELPATLLGRLARSLEFKGQRVRGPPDDERLFAGGGRSATSGVVGRGD